MNFIFFHAEQLRAESLACYGHPVSQTPNMDRLAAQGVRFDHCAVQHTVCSPSRCSLMTGWYPHVNGHRTLTHLLRPHEPNLLRYLKQAGYHNHMYGKGDTLSPAAAADSVTTSQCFGETSESIPYDKLHWPDDPVYHSRLREPIEAPPEAHKDYQNVQGAINFLRSQPREPFLISLALDLTHPPYHAPLPWHNLIDPQSLPELRPAGLPGKPDFHELIRRYHRLDELDERHLRKIQAVYLGMLAFLDNLLGRLLDALDETHLADQTAVFLLADHGDYTGDYGLVEKWDTGMEDVLTRVPLVARIPGGAAGHVVHEPVELFDVMATVLELAGVEAQHTHFARSLVPQLHGDDGDPTRAVYTEGGCGLNEPHCLHGHKGAEGERRHPWIENPKSRLAQEHPEAICRTVMLRTMTHKLVYRPQGLNELYDLLTDPRELDNVYGQPAHADEQHRLQSRMLDWLIETSDVTPFDEDPRRALVNYWTS